MKRAQWIAGGIAAALLIFDLLVISALAAQQRGEAFGVAEVVGTLMPLGFWAVAGYVAGYVAGLEPRPAAAACAWLAWLACASMRVWRWADRRLADRSGPRWRTECLWLVYRAATRLYCAALGALHRLEDT